jgi:biofilm PGA synthesis N-glycosyltransferase PgaC
MMLALLPIGVAMNYTMYFSGKKMFDQERLHIRTNREGFLIYAISYNLILQPVCLLGYLAEFLKLKKSRMVNEERAY